jgi:hypothetical protein
MPRNAVSTVLTVTVCARPDNATDMLPEAAPEIRMTMLPALARPAARPDAPSVRSCQFPDTRPPL